MTISAAEAIFLALADIDPGHRAEFLDERCGSDQALRRNVEALISALDVPDEDFLDPGRVPTLDMAAVDGPLQPGTSLGDFLVLHALGSGGMGVVYAAQQDRPRRTVAIKVLRRGFRHPEILRRFEYEAEMLGRLQHPGIAQVFAFVPGNRETPAHLVMELVTGPPLTDYARVEQLSIPGRIGLIVKLAHAMQHAHERGVIHRDLKPANVLVAEGGQPKVLDFGIARATGADVHRMTMHTAHGQLMGTLAYMSPEQLRGHSADVDARSDVYALGVLLYRLLAERLPFEVVDVPWPEAIRRVLDTEPTPIGSVNPALRGSLEPVVARAMARDVLRRYPSAADLAADLLRYLDGRLPTAAESPAPTPGGDTSHPRRTGQPPLTVFIAATDTICIATQDHLVARSAASGRERWMQDVTGVRALAASAATQVVATGLASGVIELRDLANGERVSLLHAHPGPVVALAFVTDGRQLASVGADGAARLWDTASGGNLATIVRHEAGAASLTAIADGRIAVAWHDGRMELLATPHAAD